MSRTVFHMNSYSSFFSSGLLAPYTPRVHRQDTVNSDLSEAWDSDADSFSPSSPSPPSSILLADEELMDVDMGEFLAATLRNRDTRSVTPTPRAEEGQTTPMQQSPQAATKHETAPFTSTSTTTTATTTQPRLRRRRSSLTQSTSPMNAIRSPTRAAGNALHLQMQLPASTPRSRSGSLSLGGASDAMGLGMGMYGSLVGRLRSGSCSDSRSAPLSAPASASAFAAGSLGLVTKAPLFRPRRGARRNFTAPMPALRAPPPTAPLPAVPQQQLRPANLNLNTTFTAISTIAGGAGAASNNTFSTSCAAGSLKSAGAFQTSARARGLSVSSSALGGDENRIDEEMKEN